MGQTSVQNVNQHGSGCGNISIKFFQLPQRVCGMSVFTAAPTLCCSKCPSITDRMSLKSAGLLTPKRAVFVAGVFFAAARWSRAGDAGESPYGSGETGNAGAGTDVLEECLVWWSLKGAFWCRRVFHAVRVGGESADGSSAGSRTTAPGQRGQCRRPTMRSVAACGVL
jgi:hypothetical protein